VGNQKGTAEANKVLLAGEGGSVFKDLVREGKSALRKNPSSKKRTAESVLRKGKRKKKNVHQHIQKTHLTKKEGGKGEYASHEKKKNLPWTNS